MAFRYHVRWVDHDLTDDGHHEVITLDAPPTVHRCYPTVRDPWDWTHYAAEHEADRLNAALTREQMLADHLATIDRQWETPQ